MKRILILLVRVDMVRACKRYVIIVINILLGRDTRFIVVKSTVGSLITYLYSNSCYDLIHYYETNIVVGMYRYYLLSYMIL